MTRRLFWQLLVLLVCIPGGCARVPVRGERPPVHDVHDAQSLVHAIAANEARSLGKPLSGRAEIQMEGEGAKQSATLAFLLAPPAQLRVDAATVFGIPLATFASDATRVTYFEYGSNRYWNAPVSSPALRALLLVPLSPPEFIALATGSPRLEGYQAVPASFTEGKGAYAVNLRNVKGELLTVVVNRDTLTVRELIYGGTPRELRIRFEAYRDTPLGPLPERGVVTLGKDFSSRFSLGSWKFDVAPGEGTFFIPPPP